MKLVWIIDQKKKNQNKTIKDILATIIETLDSRYYHGVVMVLKIFFNPRRYLLQCLGAKMFRYIPPNDIEKKKIYLKHIWPNVNNC